MTIVTTFYKFKGISIMKKKTQESKLYNFKNLGTINEQFTKKKKNYHLKKNP